MEARATGWHNLLLLLLLQLRQPVWTCCVPGCSHALSAQLVLLIVVLSAVQQQQYLLLCGVIWAPGQLL